MNQDRYWHMVFCIMFLIPDMNNEIFFIFLKKRFFTPILAIFCLRQQNHFSGFSRKPLNRFSRNFYTSFLSLMCRGRTSNISKIYISIKVINRIRKRQFFDLAAPWRRLRGGEPIFVRVNVWGSAPTKMSTEHFCFLH